MIQSFNDIRLLLSRGGDPTQFHASQRYIVVSVKLRF